MEATAERAAIDTGSKIDCEIAADGKSAAGKSACSKVAEILDLNPLPSGAVYRLGTLIVHQTCDDPHDPVQVEKALKHQLPYVHLEGKNLVFRNLVIGGEIKTPEIDALVPHVSKHPAVRRIVTSVLHRFAKQKKRVIAEGRDMTSVVFRDARVKIFLDADLAIRAERRWKEYREKIPGYSGTLAQVLEELRARDHEDETREHGPLRRVPEAEYIDTTHMSRDEVVERIVEIYRQKTAAAV